MHFLALVVPASAAGTCGVGPVDLSGVEAISVAINCPSNKNDEGIELGCLEKLQMTGKGKEMKQKSNTFFVKPCGTYKSSEPKCQELKFDNAAGYQVTEDVEKDGTITKTCFSIGSSKEPKFSLLDNENPDEGVKVIYEGGTPDFCKPEKPRSLEVNFHCSTQSNEMYNDVDEPDEGKCSYVMHYNTVHACPKYCVTGNTICNGNGVCGHHEEPCLCSEGFTGMHCETPGYPASNPPQGFTIAVALLTVFLFLLAGLLGFLVYMWIKLRRLAPVDTEAYSTLTSKFNELGQIT